MTAKMSVTLSRLTLSGCCLALLISCSGGGGSEANGADPGVFESPIVYVKHPIPVNAQAQSVQIDMRDPLLFSSGGDIFMRSNSTSTATETNITASVTLGTGDVKGLNASHDGKRIIFSLRLNDPNPNDNVIPSWNIYEYDLELNQLRRIISINSIAEEGNDLFPAYLPDGRIVFSSSRQRQSGQVLLDEGRPKFSALDEDENNIALVLHVMNKDGSDIHQISFNRSHDLNPLVLSSQFNGQLVFSRWDNAGANTSFNLYKINPDGSDLQVLYGVHSHATGTGGSTIQFSQAREMQNGNIMAITQPFQGTFGGGDIVIIGTGNFVDNNRPVWLLNGLTGPAQNAATINNIINDGSISRNGRYSSAFPLWDGSDRILVSKSTCQILVAGIIRPCIEPWVSNTGAIELSPAYGIWIYDTSNQTEKVIVKAEQGMVMTDIIALQPRSLPNVIFDKGPGEINTVWKSAGVGVVNIKSVYDFGGSSFSGCFLGVCSAAAGIASVSDLGDPVNATADQRPARFVRFVKSVALPDPNDPGLSNPPDLANTAFGRTRNLGMREIVGYAPVEPDGSVKVKVPANIPLAIDVLDKFGRRIGAGHQNWFQVAPGDSLVCTGCHTHNVAANVTPMAHHRSDASAPSINSGLPSGLFFANTQIPGTTDAYWGNLGQTMAEVRFDRVGLAVPPAAEPILSIDIRYDDVWTDPAARALDTSFSYLYANLDVSLTSPASAACQPWNFKCRSVINYEQHIHPIWQVNRGAGKTCTECHNNVDMAAVPKVPDGQLDLSNGISDQNADHFKSYRELFFNDAGQTLDAMGNLVNIQIQVPVLDGQGNPVLDAMGNPVTVFIDDPNAAVTPTMSVNGARGSYFIEKMTETELEAARNLSTLVTDSNYIDHTGFLTVEELRLISEWLDIGAQYFNDPFDPTAPQN